MSATLSLLLSLFVAHLGDEVVRRAAHNFRDIQVFGAESTLRSIEFFMDHVSALIPYYQVKPFAEQHPRRPSSTL